MIAYFDCFSGISGDMVVGAFLDAGVPFDWLSNELKKLPLNGYRLAMEDVKRGGIKGKRFKVEVQDVQPERTLTDIREIIGESTLTGESKDLSRKVFEKLAEAEALVHGIGVDDVHFHEVGGVDSIIDIVAAALSFSYLEIDEAYASELPLSQGMIKSSHGILPLPAPATVELLKGVPLYQSSVKGEVVTPTGAAFLASVCKVFGAVHPMRLKDVGYGAGERENEGIPNLLRVLIGEPNAAYGMRNTGSESQPPNLETDSIVVIEANIDDMNPEFYGFVMNRLFEGGALDVSLTPLYMKKERPGIAIQVLSEAGGEDKMAEILLRETSTIGVRFYRANRLKLQRKSVEVDTRFGKVRIKATRGPWGDKAQPEHDDCIRIAATARVPAREVYAEAMNQFKRGGYG